MGMLFHLPPLGRGIGGGRVWPVQSVRRPPPPQAQPGAGTDPATSRFWAPAAQLPQHLLTGGDGVQELPLPLFHGVQQLLGAFISGRLWGWPPAEPQPRLPTVHAGSFPARERDGVRAGAGRREVVAPTHRPAGPLSPP